jgi:hypothetical protein
MQRDEDEAQSSELSTACLIYQRFRGFFTDSKKQQSGRLTILLERQFLYIVPMRADRQNVSVYLPQSAKLLETFRIITGSG